jgi:hypothetical protein
MSKNPVILIVNAVLGSAWNIILKVHGALLQVKIL